MQVRESALDMAALRPTFQDFIDRVVEKVVEEGFEGEPVIARLSLVMRQLSNLMNDDAARRIYRPVGWSAAGFRICMALWVMGPLASHRVTAMTNMGRATVSAALKRITDEGLVVKEPLADDHRSVLVSLTPKGEELIRESYAWHLQIEHEWFDVFTEVEKHLFLMLLEKLLTNHPRS